MSESYHVVPWYNNEEWHEVYMEVYSDKTDKQDALKLLQMWKARCPSLPSGIESTLSLLQVHVQDVKTNNDIVDDQVLRLAYSSAIMRFVNHMLDTETAKGISLYNAAKNAGVPDWIVDLRHDTAHNSNLPSIDLLRNACLVSLQWLQQNYWDKYKDLVQDYITGQKEVYSSDENKIAGLIHFCSCLSICTHSKIKKLSDITDPNMQESMVNDARDMFNAYCDFSNLKLLSIANLINLVNTHGKEMLKSNDTVSYVNKSLLSEESLMLSLELVEHLSESDFHNKHKLSRSYVQCFEVLLTFLHTNDLISDFVLALIEMTQKNHSSKALLAALWVSEILAALRKSKKFMERANQMNSAGAVSNKKKDLKVLYRHWFPNEKIDGLILDLQKPVPSKLTNINFVQPIISSYNSYLTYFVKNLLNLLDPHLPKPVFKKICKLANLISDPDKFPSSLTSMKIYTIEDLKSDDTFDDESNVLNKSVQSNHYIQEQSINGIWKLASKYNWRSCPIGKVPWHQKSDDIQMK